MPVLKIYYDASVEEAVRTHCAAIQDGMEGMMREVLAAHPAHCQVMLVASHHCAPKPVFVDLQFRAKAHRTRAVVAQAMEEAARVLHTTLGCGLRIRAFAIDQATLHALDTDGSV